MSSLGRVKSFKRGAPPTGRLLSLKPGKRGYAALSLRKDGKTRMVYVHHIVMWAFVGPTPPRAYTLHNNDIRTDNRLANLRYGTAKENSQDAVKNGRMCKDICNRGLHDRSPENLIYHKRGARQCKPCTLEARNRAQRARRKKERESRHGKKEV